MILHEIAAANVGPFVHGRTVAGPFAPGLNILSAPNETGKSTLLKAAGRALFDRHTCKAEEIKSLQPVGTSLAPTVTVDFGTSAGRFRVEKRFLLNPRSQLEEWVAGRWQSMADADAADDRLFALLQATKPNSGAAKQTAHWGMLGYLWMRQGELAEWPEWQRSPAGQTVQGMLVQVEIDPFIEAVRSRMWSAYTENFTESTGRLRTGGALLAAEETLAKVDAELAEIARVRQGIAADEESFLRLEDDLPRLEREHADHQCEADALREAANRAALLEVEATQRRHVFETAQERLRAIRQDADTLERHARELAETGHLLTTAGTETARHQQAAAHAQSRLRAAEAAQGEHAALLTAAQAALHRMGQLGKHRRLVESIARRTQTLERANAELTSIEILTTQRGEIPALTPAKLRRLETLEETIRANRAKVEALGLTVELIPTTDATATVRPDDQPAASRPVPATGETLRALGRLTLDLPGWGQIQIRSGAGEARTLSETLATDEATVRRELSELGVASAAEARGLVERGNLLDAQLRAARQALATLLGGETADTLRATLANERRQLQSLAVEVDGEPRAALISEVDGDLRAAFVPARGVAASSPGTNHPSTTSTAVTPDGTAISTVDLDAEEQRLGVRCEGLRAEAALHNRRVKEAREAAGEAGRAREAAERETLRLRFQVENLGRESASVQARYSGGLQAARDAAEEAFVEAKFALKQAQAKLPPDAATLPDRNRRAAAAAEQVRGELARKRDALAALRGRLETLGSQGLYAREISLLAQKETLQAQSVRARARSRAARLVHDLIERRKQAATRSVLAPLQERLGARFAEVSGERERQIFLDESLRVRGLGRRDGELVDFAELSQGAKEQLLLCLRLAVAEELAAKGNGPQSLILDDVLVNTDAARQRRVLDLLDHAAAVGLQILVCTCHPDRYRGVGTVIELQKR